MNEENSQDVAAQLKKIADHLVFLEKKLDQLLDQAGNRKSYHNGFGNRDYQGPAYRSGYPQRPGFRPHRHVGLHTPGTGYHAAGSHHEVHHQHGTGHNPGAHFQKKYTTHRPPHHV